MLYSYLWIFILDAALIFYEILAVYLTAVNLIFLIYQMEPILALQDFCRNEVTLGEFIISWHIPGAEYTGAGRVVQERVKIRILLPVGRPGHMSNLVWSSSRLKI